MKNFKPIILFICLIVCSKFNVAQVIQLDFMNPAGTLPTQKTLTFKEKRSVQIDNINLSLYKVEGTFTQKNYNPEMPEIFKGIKLPGFLTTKLPAAKEADQQTKLASLVGNSAALKQTIEHNLQLIKNALDKIKTTVALDNTYKNLFSSCDKTFATILLEKQAATNTYLNTKYATEQLLSDGLRLDLNNTIATAVAAQKAIDQNIESFYSELENSLQIGNYKKAVEELENKTANGVTLTADEKIKLKAAKKMIASFDELKKDLEKQIEEAKEFVAELKKFDDENKVEKLVNNYKMINKSNFTYYSDEFVVKQDEVNIDIKISAENRLACDVPTKKNYSATYLTKGGWKLDFSTGAFANGGNSDFLGRELQYKKIDDTTVSIEAKDGGKRMLLSIGALMHFYYRSGNKVNFAISPGLSTSTAFDGLNFHLGGSVIFGGENRIVLTAGLVMREAKILDRNYNYTTNYKKAKMPEEVPAIKAFPKTGWFFGITYNWSKLK